MALLAGTNILNSLPTDTLAKDKNPWAQILLDLQGWSARWYVVILLPIVPLLARQLRLFLGEPWLRQAIHNALDQMRDIAFENLKDDEQQHHHRVTLFKVVTPSAWRLWEKRYLRPVVRSGHATQDCNVRFLIPDMADRAEGIAGLTWAQNSIVRPQPLPDVANTTNEAVLQEFANKTNVSLAWVKERRPAARSYCGLPVSVDGNLWGVLVFDSRQPDIMDVEKVQHALEAFAKTLSPLLRRF